MKKTLLALALAASAASSHAVLFGFTNEFSGATDCSFGPSGCATLEVTASGLNTHFKFQGTMIGTEFITSLYGNINPYELPVVSGYNGAFQFVEDGFKADGDGFFDWRLSLPTSPPRFNGNDLLEWDFEDVTLAQAISGLSVNGPAGKTGFTFALHAQGLANGGSGWFNATILQGPPDDPPDDDPPDPVPEPGTLALASLAMFGLWAGRKKKA